MKYIDAEELKELIKPYYVYAKSCLRLSKTSEDYAKYNKEVCAYEYVFREINYLQQKSAECIEDSVEFKEGFKAGRESGLRDGQKYVLDNLDSYGLCKPTEWSKEDKDMRYKATAILNRLCASKKEFVWQPGTLIKIFNWLKSLPERFELQPKQEWSEDYREEDIQTRFAFYTYKDEPSVLYLSNVFVEETSRNHGFGTRILKAAEKAAEAIGAITICLKVKQDSPANAWYRKHGYGYVAFENGYDWLEKNLEYLKPTASNREWSEEDETRLTNILIMLKEYVIHHYSKDDVNKSVDWLENRVKFLRPVKQEWSEEDKKRIQSILFSVGYCKEEYPNKKDYSKDINWLKSLRPQPHWKPSEQEKGALRTAIHVLTEERNFPKAATHLQNILDAFEDEEPRKEWKPSEEQMEALKEACDKHWEPDGIEPLYTLYQDLKKL